MTDNEIIKAYEEEIQKPQNFCVGTFWNTLDLINRLMEENNRQKAEIKALKMHNAQLQSNVVNANTNCECLQLEVERLKTYKWLYEDLKAEARKEVIERLNKEMGWWEEPDGYYTRFISDGELADIIRKMENDAD